MDLIDDRRKITHTRRWLTLDGEDQNASLVELDKYLDLLEKRNFDGNEILSFYKFMETTSIAVTAHIQPEIITDCRAKFFSVLIGLEPEFGVITDVETGEVI